MNILFICTGNTCRSPMAAGYFRYLLENEEILNVKVFSAGIYAGDGVPPSPNSVKALQEYGVDISDQQSMQLTRKLIEDMDLIIAMTASHRMYVGQLDPSALAKTRLLGEYSNAGKDVSDPFGGSLDVYSFCLGTMKPALETLLKEIKQQLN